MKKKPEPVDPARLARIHAEWDAVTACRCGSTQLWRLDGTGEPVCGRCHPPITERAVWVQNSAPTNFAR